MVAVPRIYATQAIVKTRAFAYGACKFACMDASWDDLRAVLAVVRGKTLAVAAAELGVNYTTVARRVSRAEAAIGEILFERLPDGYRPTDAGQFVAEHAAEMETAQNALFRGLQGRDARLRGDLVITAPQLLIAHFLAPALQTFRERHPGVSLHVRATNELLNLNRREADLAIRISSDPGDTLKGLRLVNQQNVSYASPAWAARIAEDPKGPIDWIVYEEFGVLPKGVIEAFPGARVAYLMDDMVAMVGAAQAGLGVVRLPFFLGRALPDLVQVPCLPPKPYHDIWTVAHPDVWPSAKLTAFRDVLVPYFRERRALFVA